MCYVPRMRTQLVAARTVAEALADMATGPVTAFAPAAADAPIAEIAGPREESLVDVATLLAARRGHPVRIEAVTDPALRRASTRRVACCPHAVLAGLTFEEWLEARHTSELMAGRLALR